MWQFSPSRMCRVDEENQTLIEVKILILPLYCHFGVVSVFFGFSFLA
jgi:hypothetical protein